MEPGEDAEDVEILRARFATLELEVKATQLKVDGVNENAEQLLSNDHQNSADVEERQRQLNKRLYVLPHLTITPSIFVYILPLYCSIYLL